jgi:peptidoglycan hydrolase-like protein with peptidoglycan-binding domain
MTRAEVRALQQALNQSGLAYQVLGETLDEDGIYGPATDRVHRAYLDRDQSIPTVTPPPAKPWWASRAVLGILATVIAAAAGRMGWEIADDQITAILLQVVEVGGLAVAAWGTIKRKSAIDPTLVARLPGGRDVRLPVRSDRPGDADVDPRGAFRDR